VNTKVTYAMHGDQTLISVDVPGESVTAHEDGTVTITMEDIGWRHTARAVLKEFNAAERRLPPEAVIARVRDALGDAAKQANTAESSHVARLRLASTVLHRVADMIQAGTICDVEIDWCRADSHLVHVGFQTERRRCALTIELGRGIVAEESCGCPGDLLDDDGGPMHADTCPRRLEAIA
jgi:hypothetical protein